MEEKRWMCHLLYAIILYAVRDPIVAVGGVDAGFKGEKVGEKKERGTLKRQCCTNPVLTVN